MICHQQVFFNSSTVFVVIAGQSIKTGSGSQTSHRDVSLAEALSEGHTQIPLLTFWKQFSNFLKEELSITLLNVSKQLSCI